MFFTTLTMIVPLAGPDAARKDALPGAMPVTTPAASTVAIAGLSEAQKSTTVRGSPLAARAVALSLQRAADHDRGSHRINRDSSHR